MNDTLSLAVHNALCACFGLSPNSDDALAFVRQAYTEPENTPMPARSADVLYWSVSPVSGASVESGEASETASGTHKPTVHRFLPYQLLIICYGPNCEGNVSKIRSLLFIDGSGFPLSILRKAGIYPVPNPPSPQLLFEPEGSLWRRRADLIVEMNIADSLTAAASRGAIQSTPVVIIRR